MTTADDLFALLPAHFRRHDEGLLEALLRAVAVEAEVLDDDVRQLYDDWFVETAQDWVLPYLADLYGIDELPDGPGRRAVVANTIEYRRRKGTLAVTELVARDVVGAPARVQEYLGLLTATAHLNHVRLDRPATPDLRRADERWSWRVAGGALDPASHTAEARSISSGRGRYGIGNVGVFSFDTAVHSVSDVVATPDGDWWWVHPLAVPSPLYAPPRHEDESEHLAQEEDLAVPLRPRRLLGLLRAARDGLIPATELPLRVTLGADAGALDPARVRVAGLEDLVESGPVTGRHVMVDAIHGRIAQYLDGVRLTTADAGAVAVRIGCAYGGRADVGGDPSDHAESHDEALTQDGYVRDDSPLTEGFAHQVAVDLAAGDDPAAALADIESRWSEPDSPTLGATSVVSFGDSGSWGGGLATEVPPATRLVLVGARWLPRETPDGAMLPPKPGVYSAGGVRPVIAGDVKLGGGAGSAAVIDGLTVLGDLAIEASGMIAVTVSNSTIAGAIVVTDGAGDGATALTVRVVSSMVGAVALDERAPALDLVRSIVSAEVGDRSVGAAIVAPGAHLDAVGSTVRGDARARTLSCTDVLFDGAVTIRHRQTGCARYSYLGAGSLAPRRFRCIPDADSADARRPAYLSVEPGDPSFLRLAPTAQDALRTGSETGDEIGVDAHLRRTTRLAWAGRLAAGSLPAGIDTFVRSAR